MAVFLIATFVMVGCVVTVAAIDRVWVLVPVVFIHLLATFWVLSSIHRLMEGGD